MFLISPIVFKFCIIYSFISTKNLLTTFLLIDIIILDYKIDKNLYKEKSNLEVKKIYAILPM